VEVLGIPIALILEVLIVLVAIAIIFSGVKASGSGDTWGSGGRASRT